MGVITINGVRDGIISKLSTKFPLRVYGEEIKQGFKAPCFFVKLFPVAHERELGRRYKRYHAFDIHYFPDPSKDENEDAHDMAEKLYDLMENVEVNSGLCRGAKMHHEVVDRVMHFFVDYDFHVIKAKVEDPKMKDLEQEATLK